jgi:tetratricopeptide (TPR) repeat protein
MSDDLQRAAEMHFERGSQFDEAGARTRAIAEWQAALDCDPAHIAARFNLAIAYAEEGNLDQAIAELREVIRHDPFDLEARHELAALYWEAERESEAIDQLRQILNLAPGDADAAHQLAGIYLDQEMWDEAAGALEAGGFLEADADLWVELGNAYEQQRRTDDAILAYRCALAAQLDHPDALHALERLHVPVAESDDPG